MPDQPPRPDWRGATRWVAVLGLALSSWLIVGLVRASPEQDVDKICANKLDADDSRHDHARLTPLLLDRLEARDCGVPASALRSLAEVDDAPPGSAERLRDIRDNMGPEFTRGVLVAKLFARAMLNLSRHVPPDEGEDVVGTLFELDLSLKCFNTAEPPPTCPEDPSTLLRAVSSFVEPDEDAVDLLVPAFVNLGAGIQFETLPRIHAFEAVESLGAAAKREVQRNALVTLLDIYETSSGNPQELRRAAARAMFALDWRSHRDQAAELRRVTVERLVKLKSYRGLRETTAQMVADAMVDYRDEDRELALALVAGLDDDSVALAAAEGLVLIPRTDAELSASLETALVERVARRKGAVRTLMWLAARRQGLRRDQALRARAQDESDSSLGARVFVADERGDIEGLLEDGTETMSPPVLVGIAAALIDIVGTDDDAARTRIEELSEDAPAPRNMKNLAVKERQAKLARGLAPVLASTLSRPSTTSGGDEPDTGPTEDSGTADDTTGDDDEGSESETEGGETSDDDEGSGEGIGGETGGETGGGTGGEPSGVLYSIEAWWQNTVPETWRRPVLGIAISVPTIALFFALLWQSPRTLHRIDRMLWKHRKIGLPQFLPWKLNAGGLRRFSLVQSFFAATPVRRRWVLDSLAHIEKGELADAFAAVQGHPELVVMADLWTDRDRPVASLGDLWTHILDRRSVSLHGHGASGKSHTALALARDLMLRGECLPLYFDLRERLLPEDAELDAENGDAPPALTLRRLMIEVIEQIHDLDPYRERGDKDQVRPPPEFVEALLRRGEILVVLDGVDGRRREVEALVAGPAEIELARLYPELEGSDERLTLRAPPLLALSRRPLDQSKFGAAIEVRMVAKARWQALGVSPDPLAGWLGSELAPLGLIASVAAQEGRFEAGLDHYLAALVAPRSLDSIRAALADLALCRALGTPALTSLADLHAAAEARGWEPFRARHRSWAVERSLFVFDEQGLRWRLPGLERWFLVEQVRAQLDSPAPSEAVVTLVKRWLVAVDSGVARAREPISPKDALDQVGHSEGAREWLAKWREELESSTDDPGQAPLP